MKIMCLAGQASLREMEKTLRSDGAVYVSTEGENGRALGEFVARHLPEVERAELAPEAGFTGTIAISETLERTLGISDRVYTGKSMAIGGVGGLGASVMWLGIKGLIGRPEVAVPVAIGATLAGVSLFPALKELLGGSTITPDEKGFKIELGQPKATVTRTVTRQVGTPESKAVIGAVKAAAPTTTIRPAPIPGIAKRLPTATGAAAAANPSATPLMPFPEGALSAVVGATPFLSIARIDGEVAALKREIAELRADLSRMKRALSDAGGDSK